MPSATVTRHPAAAARSRRAVPAAALTVATGLVAAIPVIASTIRALADGWQPAADQGIVATRAYDVLSAHTPLLGQYSQASTIAGHAAYSPGPLLYWLLALPARAGSPQSLVVTIGLLNTLAIVAAVALARRRGGLPLMFAAAVAIALMCRSFSSEGLHDIFNPSAPLFALMLLAFLCWSLACGEHRLLPVSVLTASFAIQCHLAFLAPSVALLAVGIAGLAAAAARSKPGPSWLRRARRRSAAVADDGGGGTGARRWPWVLAAALTALACWIAPIVDQVEHSPGNFSVLATAATAHEPKQGTAPAWRALTHTIGIAPRWLRRPTSTARALGDVSGGDYGDTRLSDVWDRPGTLATATALAVLLALLAAALAGLRRGRPDVTAAAAAALALCAALVAMVASTPTSATNALGYTLWWGSIAGMWAWLTIAFSAAALLRPQHLFASVRLPAAATAIAPLALVAAAAIPVAAAQSADAHTPAYEPIHRLASALDRAIPSGRSVWLLQRGVAVVAVEPPLRYTLRRHGVRALGHGATKRPGAWYELDHRRYDYVVAIYGRVPPPLTHARVVARVTLTDASGRHPITAALAPAR